MLQSQSAREYIHLIWINALTVSGPLDKEAAFKRILYDFVHRSESWKIVAHQTLHRIAVNSLRHREAVYLRAWNVDLVERI